METLANINFFISLMFMVCYAYQAVYLIVAFLKRRRRFPIGERHRYAVLIAARNEESVIAQLIESIKEQRYPQELLDIFVVADNCTDMTAEVAEKAGAHVYERQYAYTVGKGYALNFLMNCICEEYGKDAFDGFFVFDVHTVVCRRCYVHNSAKAHMCFGGKALARRADLPDIHIYLCSINADRHFRTC